MKLGVFGICLTILFGMQSCQKETPVSTNTSNLRIPMGFSNMDFPQDNAFTNERWALGKKLFFDPVLSRDSSISCATCHKPNLAFADDVATTPGVENRPGTRNSPSLANVGYYPYFLREGGVPTLEMQVLVPIAEHNEFDFNVVDLMQKLLKDSTYTQLAKKAYQREIDPWVITRAIATFERSLISGNSAYDDFVNGNKLALNSKEEEGMELFFSGRINCGSCHGGVFFTHHTFENNGLFFEYPDPGKYRLTGKDSDIGKFKVPSLRNVGVTSPYMHDGSLKTLREVIQHYNSGGYQHPNKSVLVMPLNLSEAEMEALEAFLLTLTDYKFMNDSRWN